jgi:hypothetical protein
MRGACKLIIFIFFIPTTQPAQCNTIPVLGRWRKTSSVFACNLGILFSKLNYSYSQVLEAAGYFFIDFVSVKMTCCRTTGSYFLKASFLSTFLGFFLVV